MNNKETDLLQGIYLEYLKTINNVNFTRREIEIIAFFVSGRSAKKAASFFSISPKTVENHTHNIMLKLHCNSREGIIDFVEKSDKLGVLRKFYTALLAQTVFAKYLKDIAQQTQGKILSCIITYWGEKGCCRSLIDYLQSALKLVGIEVSIQERNSNSSIQEIIKKDHLIYFSPKEWNDHPIKTEEMKLFPKGKDRLFLFCPERKEPFPVFKELESSEEPKDINQKNYPLIVLEILKKLFPTLNWNKIIADFKSEYEIIEGQIKEDPPLLSSEEKTIALDIKNSIIKAKSLIRSKPFFIIFFLCFVSILIYSFLSMRGVLERKRTKNPQQVALHISNNELIRSDFNFLNEYLLLNRADLIEEIKAKLKGKKGIQTIALVGIGGSGKTTLARHYYLTHSKDFPVIGEINAETKESLKESFENLGQALANTNEDEKLLKAILKIKNLKEREEKIVQFVKDRLKKFPSWFLLYNNVVKFVDIQKFFPRDPVEWGAGKVIITTRNSNIGHNPSINFTIPIGELTAEQKLNLFIKIMSNGGTNAFTPVEVNEAKNFLEGIPSFPLDIWLAAHHIKTTNVSYKDYLEALHNGNEDFSNTQEKILQEAGDYTNTRYRIIMLSLNHLMSLHNDFKDLLLLISLLDSQNIPRDLLIKYKSPVVVDNFIYHLKAQSLTSVPLTYRYGDSNLSLHRSTQALTLAYLTKKLELHQNNKLIQILAMPLVNFMRDAVDKEDFVKMKNLYRHAEHFLNHKSLLSSWLEGLISGELGCFYYYLSDSSKAKQLLTHSLFLLNQNGNESTTDAAHFLVYLGNVYRDLGDYKKAKELFKKSIIIYKKHPEDPVGMARASGYLGVVYRYLGDFKKAKKLLEHSLSVYKENPDKPIGVAWAQAHLGNVYKELGDFKKARELLEQSLIIYKKDPQTHVGAAWVCGDLGYVYLKLKEFEKAKALLEENLAICKKYFYEGHAYVAKALMYLGIYYRERGDYKKGKDLLKNSLTIYETTYGRSHIKTSFISKNLGEVYLLESDFDAAEVYMKKALEAFHKNPHPDKYNILELLADISKKRATNAENKGEIQQAKELKKQEFFYLKQAYETIKTYYPEDIYNLEKVEMKLKEYTKDI